MIRRHNQGFSLIGVLILLLIISIGAVAMFSSMKNQTLLGGLFRRKLMGQEIAESGVAKAKGYLLTIAKGEVAHSKDPTVSVAEDASWQQIVLANYNTQILFDGGSSGFPNYSTCQDDYCSFVMAYTVDGSSANLSAGDMRLLITSSVTNKKTNEVFTVESLISLGFMSFAKIAFGVLDPAGNGPFYFDNS